MAKYTKRRNTKNRKRSRKLRRGKKMKGSGGYYFYTIDPPNKLYDGEKAISSGYTEYNYHPTFPSTFTITTRIQPIQTYKVQKIINVNEIQQGMVIVPIICDKTGKYSLPPYNIGDIKVASITNINQPGYILTNCTGFSEFNDFNYSKIYIEKNKETLLAAYYDRPHIDLVLCKYEDTGTVDTVYSGPPTDFSQTNPQNV